MADGLNLDAERAAFEKSYLVRLQDRYGRPLNEDESAVELVRSSRNDSLYLYAESFWQGWLMARATPPAPSTAPSDELPETTDDARAYLVRWHREAFTTAPFFSSHIENTLAGDFAYHLARWLARHANKKGT